MRLDDAARELIGAGADATLVTLNPDGSSQPEGPDDGVRRPYLAINGTARVAEGGAPELLRELAQTLADPGAQFPPKDAPPGFVTRIRIDKVGGVGPWAS